MEFEKMKLWEHYSSSSIIWIDNFDGQTIQFIFSEIFFLQLGYLFLTYDYKQ